jgi:hypothetical protein
VLEARHVDRIEEKLDAIEAELLRGSDAPLLPSITVNGR